MYGILRRQGTLEFYLRQLLHQPPEGIDQSVLLLLKLGLYQLLYLERVPYHAAVNETVSLARHAVPRASGLVNAVLRNFIRKKNKLNHPEQIPEPAARIAASFSVPIWIAEEWLGQFSAEEAMALASASSEIPPLTLRANTTLCTREKLLETLAASDIAATQCTFSPEGISLHGRHRVTDIPGFHEGHFAVQDEASQIAVHLLAPLPGHSVLDVCAAPGGKTTHIAQLLEGNGILYATDISSRKVQKITDSARRLRLDRIQTEVMDALSPEYMKGRGFDRIRLDVPCSGLGVIRRNPDARWRLKHDDFPFFADRQRRLLDNIAPLLKPGGILLYSTCSTAKEENELIINDFLSCNRGFVLENMSVLFPGWDGLFSPEGNLRLWPHIHNTDGFFAARIKKADR